MKYIKFLNLYLLFIVVLLSSCTTTLYRGPVSDHFDGRHFYYYGEKDRSESFLLSLLDLTASILKNPWSTTLSTLQTQGTPYSGSGVKITFINHGTVLIQSKNVTILTDPIYSYRASPFPWVGPIRRRDPGIAFEKLPPIDLVLISHNHYDHLDIATLRKLNERFHPLFIVPLGNKALLNSHYIFNVIELDWWEKYKYKNLIITFLPSRHSSARWLDDYDRTLWGSYGITNQKIKIYFAGDTGFGPHFAMIAKEWGHPDIALLPIGAYEPRKLVKHDHINPNESVKASLILNAHYSMGIHYGTFHLGSEKYNQPLYDLALARRYYNVSEKNFFVREEGFPLFFESGVLKNKGK